MGHGHVAMMLIEGEPGRDHQLGLVTNGPGAELSTYVMSILRSDSKGSVAD